ncbi:hypothetical protein GCM10027031_11870 [Corynebacterium atrinae]
METWISDNKRRWFSGTVTAYRYRARALQDLWDLPVTAVRPADLRGHGCGVCRACRDQAKRIRTIVRATFDLVERWTEHPQRPLRRRHLSPWKPPRRTDRA